LYFNPYDPEDIASVMERLMDQPELRRVLIENGHMHVQSASWQRAIGRVGAAYEFACSTE
jgi:hypothetical protein